MKLVKISSAYPSYIDALYDAKPDLASRPYLEQREIIDFDGFAWADFWPTALKKLGYDAVEFRGNIKPLQRTWAKEHSIPFDEKTWIQDIVRAQVLHEKPDVLFVDEYSAYPYAWLNELRNDCPSIKLILGWCGAPFSESEVFKAYDVVLTCIPEFQKKFSEMGHETALIAHAFEPRILERIKLEQKPRFDVSFIGRIVRTHSSHLVREQLLEELVSKTPITVFSPMADLSKKEELKALLKIGFFHAGSALDKVSIAKKIYSNIPKLSNILAPKEKPVFPVNLKLKRHMRAGLYGLEMFQALHDSKITFNNHIGVSPNSASNMRLFEATGVGTCLITDWKQNISNYFEPEKEVVTYKSPEELVEKVNWLLNNPDDRVKIAKAGQKRALKDHTFDHRAKELDRLIKLKLR